MLFRWPPSLTVLVLLIACGRAPAPSPTGPVTIEYWAGWTGFEGEAITAVVDEFNKTQTQVHVRLLVVSQVEEKLLIATAGGDPPDLASLYSRQIPQYGHAGALTDLETFIEHDKLDLGIYTRAFLDLGQLGGRTLALPQTGITLALHWNKAMFLRAGLNPETPPKTIAELDSFAETLTRHDPEGRILQAGFMPTEPGWWNEAWPYFFGGRIWDGHGHLTLDEPSVARAYGWVQSYARRYDAMRLNNFRSGFGNFSSPQNAFLSGKVAMILQGVWMANFIQNYAPRMSWGASPFPVENPALGTVTKVESDMLIIPKGARHPEEAWLFMKYMARPGILEKFNLLQKKFPPLRVVQKSFIAAHPNPYIKVFIELAESRVFRDPPLDLWSELQDHLSDSFERIWLLQTQAADELQTLQKTMQPKLDRELRRRADN